MHEKVFDQYKLRVKKCIESLEFVQYTESVQLEAVIAVTDNPVPYDQRLDLEYEPIECGETWGETWQSAWLLVRTIVPKSFDGKELCLRINVGGEALVFDAEGCPAYSLTGMSVFSNLYSKERMVIGRFAAGAEIEYWIECAANGLFGVELPVPPNMNPIYRNGHLDATISHLELCVFDRAMWNFIWDIKFCFNLLEAFDWHDYRAQRLLNALNLAVDAYNYEPANAAKASKVLKEKVFANAAASTALSVCTIGHAHIDVGWLWPVRESIRKAARTFSSQITLMEKYPDYTFGASQAVLYRMVRDNYPKLYEKMKARISEGRWEVQGGMWVEADANIISGESMVRQFLHGKNYFKDEFGVEVRNLWLPDVFGYSAAMPQIIKKSGCDYFLTQKISWSQINHFPHNTFKWRGIDGTEVLTHFPPENSYNSWAMPQGRIAAQNRFEENGYLEEFMSLIGIGDGGGGPSEDFVEYEHRNGNVDGCPKSRFGRADEFFNRLEKHSDELPVWNGELYLEMHRGTLTTQSRTKRNNRKCEQALTALEFLASSLPYSEYPNIDELWKTLLTNQFHDILPGSSIGLVYETTEKEHAEILATVEKEMARAAGILFQKDSDSAVLVNSLSYPWTGLLPLPDGWTDCGAAIDGKEIPVQTENGKAYALVTVQQSSFTTIRRGGRPAESAKMEACVLENELVRYEFAANGRLKRAFDKIAGREALCGDGNILYLEKDRPLCFEAWDVEVFRHRDLECEPEGELLSASKGPAFSVLRFAYKLPNSTIEQRVVLRNGSRRLDFETVVDWHERRKMLRVAFPANVMAETATYDIQYGFIKRPTHANTSWDLAKFEVCGQRYADISCQDYGVALLNDCKYGYHVNDSTIELTLLRSPTHPHFDADQGHHIFTYSLLPHSGRLEESDVFQEAACLNRTPFMADGMAADIRPLAWLESDSATLEVVKKAEKENAHVLRINETRGRNVVALLHLNASGKLVRTNLIEWERGEEIPIADGVATISLRPFEIATFILCDKEV